MPRESESPPDRAVSSIADAHQRPTPSFPGVACAPAGITAISSISFRFPARWPPLEARVSPTATRITQSGQLQRVPLAGCDRAKDRHPGRAWRIGYRLMHPHIHLIQTFLHPPHPIGLLGHQHRFLPPQRAQFHDLFGGPETTLQQSATGFQLTATGSGGVSLLFHPHPCGGIR